MANGRHARRPMGATGLRTIELLAATPSGLTLREIARSLNLDPGQAHRLLGALAEDGWVAQGDAPGQYRATGRLLSMAGLMLQQLDLRRVASPVMAELQKETGETVGLAELRGDSLICIHRVLSEQSLSVGTQIGEVIPLNGTATGRAVQAARARTGAGASSESPETGHRTEDASSARARRLGYVLDDEVYRPAVRAVAAAILDFEGQPLGGLFVAAPTARTPLERAHRLGDLTATAAASVSSSLGYREPPP